MAKLDPYELNEIEAEAATIIGKHYDVLQQEPAILKLLREIRDMAHNKYAQVRNMIIEGGKLKNDSTR